MSGNVLVFGLGLPLRIGRRVLSMRWVLLFACGFMLPSALYAEVYKWVDEEGNVHYTDKPPSDQRSETKSISVEPTKFSSSLYGTKSVKTAEPLRAVEGRTRLLRLESIVMELTSEGKAVSIIGKKHTGPGCAKSFELRHEHNRQFINPQGFVREFNSLLNSLGYKAEDKSQALFAGQMTQAAELSLAGIITALEINGCEPSIGGKAKYASYLRMDWKLFDNLGRKVVYESTTEGSSSQDFEGHMTPLNASVNLSFTSALKNLLARQEMANLLAGKVSPAGPSSTASLSVLQLNVRYDSGAEKFVDIVEGLKKATVTVRSAAGHGSGFFITNAHLLTNAHVVGAVDRAVVILGDKELEAEVLRKDEARDIALLKVANDITGKPLSLYSRPAASGETVYLIGTPMDEILTHSVTRGIISAYRQLNDGQGYYQTDAVVNPGNSGGPAFNERGEVLGIAVAGVFTTGGGQTGINFLIPIDSALKALKIESLPGL